MSGKKILVAGGSGFIGSELVKSLAMDGHEVAVLSRHPNSKGPGRFVHWDGQHEGNWTAELDESDVVINLSGESISQRWDHEVKQRILQSRLDTTGVFCCAIRDASSPPPRWINASAIGYYGDRGTEILTEQSDPGTGFLAETCVAWERAVSQCQTPHTAKCRVRFGTVLGCGGALPPLTRLARLGLGGPAGNGHQIISWIHIRDLIAMLKWLSNLPDMPEAINATSPNPETNREFMRTLRRTVHAPLGLPAPAFAVRAVGTLIGPDSDLILAGAHVSPRIAIQRGFAFEFPELESALNDLLGAKP